MNKISFICGILSIGIIVANLKPVHSAENAQDAQTATPPQPSGYTPSLSCILYKDLGCNVQCSYLGKLQNARRTVGKCNENQACTCNMQSESLNSMWPRKFDSDDILMQLKQDKPLFRKVRKILRNPYRTGEQSKQDLKGILPEEILEKLRLKYDTTRLNQKNPDIEDLKKFVKDHMFYEMLGSRHYNLKHPERNNWLLNLFNFLRETKDDASIQSVYHQIALTDNDILKDKLDDYLKRYPDAPKVDTTVKYEQDSEIPQTVINMVVDGMINQVALPEDFRNFP